MCIVCDVRVIVISDEFNELSSLFEEFALFIFLV